MAEVKTLLVGLLALCLVNSCFCNSWDAYIDNLIAQSKDTSGVEHVDKASIFGLDTSRWTSVNGDKVLEISSTEVNTIATAFRSSDFNSFMSDGVNVSGVKYQFLKVEDDKTVYAKKKDHGGIVMMASKTAVVIAHYPEGKQSGNAVKAVGVIAEYLESLNM
ncbi:hypothetical protein SNE40_023526 [Patella caerulea]|uniref:Profilin n=1 Tax=Patella caerulea TaxID=87958 RepID=A0AAN8GAA9_PATCE